MGGSNSYALDLLLMFTAGAGSISMMATANTTLQLAVPDELRGRVMSVYTTVFAGRVTDRRGRDRRDRRQRRRPGGAVRRRAHLGARGTGRGGLVPNAALERPNSGPGGVAAVRRGAQWLAGTARPGRGNSRFAGQLDPLARAAVKWHDPKARKAGPRRRLPRDLGAFGEHDGDRQRADQPDDNKHERHVGGQRVCRGRTAPARSTASSGRARGDRRAGRR